MGKRRNSATKETSDTNKKDAKKGKGAGKTADALNQAIAFTTPPQPTLNLTEVSGGSMADDSGEVNDAPLAAPSADTSDAPAPTEPTASNPVKEEKPKRKNKSKEEEFAPKPKLAKAVEIQAPSVATAIPQNIDYCVSKLRQIYHVRFQRKSVHDVVGSFKKQYPTFTFKVTNSVIIISDGKREESVRFRK